MLRIRGRERLFAFCLLTASWAPCYGDTIQFGFSGDAQLNGNSIFFGQYPNGAPYTPPPGFGSYEVALVNGGLFSNNGLTTGEFGNIQSLTLQTGSANTFGPFMTFDGPGATNLQLWATSIPAGTDGPLTGVDTPDGAVVSFDVNGYTLDSNNPSFKQNFFSTFSLTFAGMTVADVLNGFGSASPFTATVSLVAPPPPNPPATVPEPASTLLLGGGLCALGALRFRKREAGET